MRVARCARSFVVLTVAAAASMVAVPVVPAFAAGPSAAVTPNGAPATLVFSTSGEVGTVAVMGRAGQQLTIATALGTFSTNCDVRLRLRAPDNSLLAGPVCAGTHGTVSVASLPVDGSYTVSLTAGATATGSLNIAAKSSGGPLSITPDAPPLKVTWPPQTNLDIRLGFTGGEGDVFTIVATGGNGNQPCLLLARFVDANGDPVGNTGIQCAAGGAYVHRTTLPAAGTFFVQLLGYDSKPLFVQLFHVVDQVIPVATDGTPAPFNTPMPGQDARFTFSATAGQQVSAVLQSTWAGFSQILLLSPDGTLVAANQTTGFLQATTLDETGTWTIVVDRNNLEPDSGTVRVYTFNDITAAADLSGAPHDLSLVPGQRAIYSFSGTSGQKVSALLTKIKPGPCWFLKQLLTLVRPDESVAADSACSGKRRFLDATTLNVSGTWKVVVDPPGPAAETATLQIFDIVDQTGAVATDGTPTVITISAPGQNARLSFTAPQAHQTVTVAITDATLPSCLLQLIKPGTGLVDQASCSFGTATVGPIVIGNGSYEVLLDPFHFATGTATLKVTFGA